MEATCGPARQARNTKATSPYDAAIVDRATTQMLSTFSFVADLLDADRAAVDESDLPKLLGRGQVPRAKDVEVFPPILPDAITHSSHANF